MSELEKTPEQEVGNRAEAGQVTGREEREFRLQPAVDIFEDRRRTGRHHRIAEARGR